MLREPVDPSCPSESSDNPHPRFTRSLMLIEYAHELIQRARAALFRRHPLHLRPGLRT